MPNLWNLLVSLFWILPWLLIAFGAGLALVRRKKSMPLLLQLLGALGTILILPGRELIFAILNATHAPYNVYSAVGILISFTTFALLLLFAVGYCWEKLGGKKA